MILLGLLWSSKIVIPVKDATKQDWNAQSFWFEPWGVSGVHKGIDIFAATGTPLLATTDGFVVYKGTLGIGGKVIAVLGPKWRIHYYAHLHKQDVALGDFVKAGEPIGEVGSSGNARGKAPHVHYAIVSLLPYIWRWDLSTQGWKKIFYLNPSELLVSY